MKSQRFISEVNDRMAQSFRRLAFDGPTGFICECGARDCMERIYLTLDEYRTVRLHPKRLAIARGHPLGAREHVVEKHERFAVVEKVGGEAATRRVAGELAPATVD